MPSDPVEQNFHWVWRYGPLALSKCLGEWRGAVIVNDIDRTSNTGKAQTDKFLGTWLRSVISFSLEKTIPDGSWW